MAGLRFKFEDIIREMRALKTMAEEFLDRSTVYALEQLESGLTSMQSAGKDQERRLKLQRLHTKPNDGAHEPGNRQGAASVYAVITGRWDVRACGDNPKKEKAKRARLLEFSGIASTKIELYDKRGTEEPIAIWRMEVGSEDGPGCHFHVHILGNSDDPLFPSTIPIPRLPSIFITPMGVIEYVLGELFQDRWERAAMRNRNDSAWWHHVQLDRFRRLLNWHQEQLANSIGSPWMTLKAAKPDGDTFCK